jgi:DNA primase
VTRYDDRTLEELRERANIVEIIGAHVRLRRAGRNYVGLCPFHNEKTPSFSVNPERGFFHCFGCGAGGTVFNFIMRQEGLTFPEAVRSLATRYGLMLPEVSTGSGTPAGARDAIFNANEVAAAFYSHVLWKTPEGAPARAYLASRGVNEEAARTYALGFAPVRPGSLTRALGRRKLLEPATKAGLIRRDGATLRELFAGRVIFPIRDGQGRVMAFGGRVLDARLPKYINSPESPVYVKSRSVYGIYEARAAISRADRVIVVEGYLDAIAASQGGFKETVASLGTSLTVEQLRLVGRYTRNVIACFDGDEAGRKASLRALEIFLAAGLLGRGAFLPAGFDPDTLIRQHGAAAFGAVIEEAELLADFFVRENVRAAGNSIEGRARAAARVAEVLQSIANPFEFDLIARKAAELLGVDEKLMRRSARRPAARAYAHARDPIIRTSTSRNERSAAADAEFGIGAIAMSCPEMRPEIAARAVTRDFANRTVADLVDRLCSGEFISADQFIAERFSEEERSRISAMIVSMESNDPNSVGSLLEDYCTALNRRRAELEAAALKRSVAEAGGDEAARRHLQDLIRLRRGEPHGGGIE